MVLYYTNTEQISASEHRIVAMSWQVNLGEERGVHQLQVDTRLTFGRSTECDVVVKVRVIPKALVDMLSCVFNSPAVLRVVMLALRGTTPHGATQFMISILSMV